MNIECGDLLTIYNKKYITLKKVNYDSKCYIFVNEIVGNDDVSDCFDIFELRDDSIVIISDVSLKSILLLKFEKLLKEDINLFF